MHTTRLLLIVAASLASACAPEPEPPQTVYAAYSSDGRVSFHLPESAVNGAYATFCESQASCDAVENYRLNVVIDNEGTLITFIHRNMSLPRGLARAFLCSNAGEGWTCTPPPNQPAQ
jgi:hypothetical protein